ncbi:MAG: valine--tRNA ligase [Pyrinomonadaceae bacterium]
MEIPKQYNPQEAEGNHYARWEAENCFAPEINRDPAAPVFTIVIPPPNITGSLHMGHALQHTLMDVLVRHKRMCGYRTLWVPGTDHAGISTQLVVERELKKEGITRHELGREKFVERVWQWKQEYGSRITEQIRREGASVDWSRERFTMDEGLSRAVREVFVRLYEERLIYRGDYIVNWCPHDQTVLSDLEVEKESHKGQLYYLRYPVKNSDRQLSVATTRPETMLGDTAVAVNPADERYRDLIGRTLLLPLANREIPVIADEYVDAEFGTGAVKITPAHDPNDYEMGLRHNLPQVVVIDKYARMTATAGAEFSGLDRYEARAVVVEKFETLGLLEKVVDYEFAISRCERCKTVIEPLVSTQWFCRMNEMRRAALDSMERDGPRFTPEAPYEKVYTNWLENLRDWTISRQLWWGHQIPAWYTADGRTVVAHSAEEARQKAGTDELTQDQDVLDTWFSSALWPFSTLGWPDETADLKTFYPTSVLVTARDIIFLWVARMVMEGIKFAGAQPFRDVVITGTVLDKSGQRMSKSKGTGVDPLDVFAKYGVDATRLALASIGSTDTRWNDNQVESYRNFANKIWNAARFCLLNSEGAETARGFDAPAAEWSLHDRWIVSRLNRAAREVNEALARYDFYAAVQTLYHFFWDDFCDWYIELSKADVTAADDSAERRAARSRLMNVLEQSLRLLHPLMPFITEELWQRLPGLGAHSLHPAYRASGVRPTIMLAAYPQPRGELIDDAAEAELNAMTELISRVRNIRAEMNIKPAEHIQLHVTAPDAAMRQVYAANLPQIERICALRVHLAENGEAAPHPAARAVLSGGGELAVPLAGLIDFTQERARLAREQEKLEKEAGGLESQLANAQFVARAPAEKVQALADRRAEITRRTGAIKQMLEALQKWPGSMRVLFFRRSART